MVRTNQTEFWQRSRIFEQKNQNLFRKETEINFQKESEIPVVILRYLPFLRRLPSKSIFHSSYYRISLQKDVINVTTVYDFIYEKFRFGLAKYIHFFQKKIAIKHSDAIICISQSTKNDLIELFPELINPESKLYT